MNFDSTRFFVTKKKLERIHWKNVLKHDFKKYTMKGCVGRPIKRWRDFVF
jgi:hypothetical protein